MAYDYEMEERITYLFWLRQLTNTSVSVSVACWVHNTDSFTHGSWNLVVVEWRWPLYWYFWGSKPGGGRKDTSAPDLKPGGAIAPAAPVAYAYGYLWNIIKSVNTLQR